MDLIEKIKENFYNDVWENFDFGRIKEFEFSEKVKQLDGILSNMKWDDSKYNLFNEIKTLKQKEICEKLDLEIPELVDSYGGEGEGEQYYRIYYFKKENLYIKASSYYTSYDGVDWKYNCDLRYVAPITKTITVYE
jgi:hypothetical protein